MSDRVSRLAEIRKRREARGGSAKEEGGERSGVTSLREDGLVSAGNAGVGGVSENTLDPGQGQTELRIEDENTRGETKNGNLHNIESVKEPESQQATLEEQTREFVKTRESDSVMKPDNVKEINENTYEDAEQATSKVSKAVISHNSDLKEDLHPLYMRAHHGTERAVNRIIQRRYQESLEEA